MEVKNHVVKVSTAMVPVDKELSVDDDVVLAVTGSVVKVEDGSNQDGTVTRTYVIRGMIASVMHKQEKILLKEEEYDDDNFDLDTIL